MARFLTLSLISLVLGAASVAVPTSSAKADCRKPNCWGAIAIGTRNGAWAYVYNHPSKRFARRRALRKCRGRCNRVLTFRNSCAAYAVARNGGWGWSNGYRTKRGAQRRALYECRKRNRGRGCRIRVWACTAR